MKNKIVERFRLDVNRREDAIFPLIINFKWSIHVFVYVSCASLPSVELHNILKRKKNIRRNNAQADKHCTYGTHRSFAFNK